MGKSFLLGWNRGFCQLPDAQKAVFWSEKKLGQMACLCGWVHGGHLVWGDQWSNKRNSTFVVMLLVVRPAFIHFKQRSMKMKIYQVPVCVFGNGQKISRTTISTGSHSAKAAKVAWSSNELSSRRRWDNSRPFSLHQLSCGANRICVASQHKCGARLTSRSVLDCATKKSLNWTFVCTASRTGLSNGAIPFQYPWGLQEHAQPVAQAVAAAFLQYELQTSRRGTGLEEFWLFYVRLRTRRGQILIERMESNIFSLKFID